MKIKDLVYKIMPKLKKHEDNSSNLSDVIKIEPPMPVVEKEVKNVEKELPEGDDKFSLRLSSQRKEHVAKKIIEDSDV